MAAMTRWRHNSIGRSRHLTVPKVATSRVASSPVSAAGWRVSVANLRLIRRSRRRCALRPVLRDEPVDQHLPAAEQAERHFGAVPQAQPDRGALAVDAGDLAGGQAERTKRRSARTAAWLPSERIAFDARSSNNAGRSSRTIASSEPRCERLVGRARCTQHGVEPSERLAGRPTSSECSRLTLRSAHDPPRQHPSCSGCQRPRPALGDELLKLDDAQDEEGEVRPAPPRHGDIMSGRWRPRRR